MENNLSPVTDVIVAQVLDTLRANSRMPQLVNSDFATDGAQRFARIPIPKMNEFTTRAVSPGVVHSEVGQNAIDPSVVDLVLDKWEEVAFKVTDKDYFMIKENVKGNALQQAVETLASRIDTTIIEAAYQGIYNFIGTAGTPPFNSDTQLIRQCYTTLSAAKANMSSPENLNAVIDPFAAGNVVGLANFEKVNEAGTDTIRTTGSVRGGVNYGFTWNDTQNIPTHSTAHVTGVYAIDAAATAGVAVIVVDNGAGAAPSSLVVGDKFTIAGNSQQYTITGVTAGSPSATEDTYNISPGLAGDVADGDVLTVIATDFISNLFFHRQAIAFASRPLEDIQPAQMAAPEGSIVVIPDPISGLNLRLEITRQNKQTQWSLDALWGVVVARPEVAVIVLG